MRPHRARIVLAAAAFLLLGAAATSAEEREHFQLKVTPYYDQGDFGTGQTTRTYFLPLTFRYLGDKFDVAVTAGLIAIDTPGNVTIIEGTTTPTARPQTARETNVGFSDIVLKGRYFLLQDAGLPSPWPSLTPFVKLKIPTGDSSKDLSTGEPDGGFGVEFDKTFGRWIVFGDASYTIMGSPPHEDFHNRPGGSIGAGVRVSKLVTLSSFVDWRGAIVSRTKDAVELYGLATFSVSPTVSISPFAFAGLTSGSPDFGVGVEFAYKFGRY